MVITENPVKISIKEPKLEITVFELEKFKKIIEKYPVMYCQMVKEAEPLINAYVLDDLKKIKTDYGKFKEYIKETKEHIKSSRELVELDRLDSEFVKSNSPVYSTILRLRGSFIMRCLLNKAEFSNKSFKKWLNGKGIGNSELNEFYNIYMAVRDNRKIGKLKIKIQSIEKLLNILENELIALGAKI